MSDLAFRHPSQLRTCGIVSMAVSRLSANGRFSHLDNRTRSLLPKYKRLQRVGSLRPQLPRAVPLEIVTPTRFRQSKETARSLRSTMVQCGR
jgi:hypothetical protein